MIWSAAAVERFCGSCGRVIDAGQPFGLVTALQKIRCPGCVALMGLGPVVDQAAVDAALAAIEADRAPRPPAVPTIRAPRSAPAPAAVVPARKPAARVLPFSEVADKVPEDRW